MSLFTMVRPYKKLIFTLLSNVRSTKLFYHNANLTIDLKITFFFRENEQPCLYLPWCDSTKSRFSPLHDCVERNIDSDRAANKQCLFEKALLSSSKLNGRPLKTVSVLLFDILFPRYSIMRLLFVLKSGVFYFKV